jgi:hypothetical protein
MNDSSSARVSLARSIGVCLVILALCGGIVWCFHSCGREIRDTEKETIELIKQAFVQVLQLTPQISVNNKILVSQTVPIAELAVVSKEFDFKKHYSDTWLHSEKTLDLQAQFRAKVGFDLHESFRVTIKGRPPKAYIALPQPKLLSCEMTSKLTVDESNGLWNRISSQDRDGAEAVMRNEARKQAEQSSLKEEAKAEVEKNLRELLGDKIGSISFEPARMHVKPAKHD